MKRSILSLLSLLAVSASFANNVDQPALAHPVGSCYGGGVVFYVNKEPNPPAGQQGLIAALNDVYPGTLAWDGAAPPADATYVRTASSYFTGLDNTHRILNTVNNYPNPGDKTWPAAQYASQYTTSETCPTCTAWYLPSQDELATLYFQSVNFKNFWNNASCVGTAPDGTYWSSSQLSQSRKTAMQLYMAWQVTFNSGLVINTPTFGGAEVRAIRAF